MIQMSSNCKQFSDALEETLHVRRVYVREHARCPRHVIRIRVKHDLPVS